MKLSLQFFLALAFILLLDTLWLGFIMNKFYQSELGALAKVVDGKFAPNFWAASMVYLALAIGVVILVLPRSSDPLQTFIFGAVFGFVVYAVYDFTNLATLQNYSLKMTLIDVVWGTFLCGTASILVKLVEKKFAS